RKIRRLAAAACLAKGIPEGGLGVNGLPSGIDHLVTDGKFLPPERHPTLAELRQLAIPDEFGADHADRLRGRNVVASGDLRRMREGEKKSDGGWGVQPCPRHRVVILLEASRRAPLRSSPRFRLRP